MTARSQIEFSGTMVCIGCGGVAQCTLPMLVKQLRIRPSQIILYDFVDNRNRVKELIDQGLTYNLMKITEDNIRDLPLAKGDILLDLSYNIDTITLLEFCHAKGVHFVNTSVEEWDPYGDPERPPQELTLYARQLNLRRFVERNGRGPTMIVDHGANPGLVSHFVKSALIELATKILLEKCQHNEERAQKLKNALEKQDFALLAYYSGVTTIHVSERDSQITVKPKGVGEFVNTWSPSGFVEEGQAPAELGWGTHEKELPYDAITHDKEGPKNQICLQTKGIDALVRSFVPSGPIIGMVIRHGESFSISDFLTVWEKTGRNGGNVSGTEEEMRWTLDFKSVRPIYRPTVHYAYCPCDAAWNSIHEFRMREFEYHSRERVLNDDICEGMDELGVLLLGHDFGAWWTGSLLDIHESRKIVPNQNATTVQVAAGVVSALAWTIKNPNKGLCLPDHLDHDFVMELPVDWNPLRSAKSRFIFGKDVPKEEDAWQFNTLRYKYETYGGE